VSALAEIESRFEQLLGNPDPACAAEEPLELAEKVLEQWIIARGETPTYERREGFRLLALHHQGAEGLPSFNACRETCRELVYHYNLLTLQPAHADSAARLRMMAHLGNHLCLFVIGKCQVEGLGEFCCAARPIRTAAGNY
jgi:hypothetical protein